MTTHTEIPRHRPTSTRTFTGALIALVLALAAVLGGTIGTAHAAANSDRLTSNEALNAGERIVSPGGRFALVMQTDGNLVVYGPSGSPWSSNTQGSGGSRAVMQSDGNLVIYTANGTPVFATGTRGSGPALVMQTDGNLVTYTAGGPVWASNNTSERAIQWFYNHQGNTSYEGKCELAVENSFATSGRYATARANWNSRSQQFPYAAAPRGALVFYSTSSAGHVAISLGNGKVISSSANGRIGIVANNYFQNPLGWAWAPW